MQGKNIAAIDLGTNDCRLVITDDKGNLILRETEQIKLGEGLIQGGNFSDQAIERGFKCLSNFSSLMKQNQVNRYKAIATASCRMAQNGKQFLQMIKKMCGLKIDIISPQEEALLTLQGALLNADQHKPYILVFDIGGGSTEITLATHENLPKILYTLSIPLGARTAAEKYDIVEFDAEKTDKLRAEIKQYVQDFSVHSEFLMYQLKCQCLATSSVPLRLASMIENKGVYQREVVDGKTFSINQFYDEIGHVYEMTLVEMAKNPHIGEKRAPIFVASCLIFETICRTLQIDRLTASLKGAQEAIIQDLVANKKAGEIWQN